MNYFSLNNPANTASFSQAVIKGIAPDRGLYFPEKIPTLPAEFFDQIDSLDIHSLAV